MAKKAVKKNRTLKVPLEQSIHERLIDDHKRNATTAYLALVRDVNDLRSQGRSSEELSFILARKGVASESATLLPQFNKKFSESQKTILKRESPSQCTIDALMGVDVDVRSVALGRMRMGATLGRPDVLLVADELHRRSLSYDGQRSLDLHLLLEQQTFRLAAEGRHPFQNELSALLDLCDEYKNLVYLREIEFADLKANGRTQASGPPASTSALASVKKRAKKVLDNFDDLFEWAEVPRSRWAHLYLVDPNASLLAQARFALEEIAKGNLHVLDRPWSVHFSHTGGAALEHLLRTPPAKAGNRNKMTRPTRVLNAAVIGNGTFGVALGLEAAGYAIRAIYEENKAARANIRSRRSDWKVQKAGTTGNGTLYKQLKRNRVGQDLNLLAGMFGIEAWNVRSDEYDRYPGHVRIDELLAELSPDAFFFELPSKFSAIDMMALKIEQLGYTTEEFVLSLTDFHVPQARTRAIFCGIKKSFGTRVSPPVVGEREIQLFTYLGDAIRVKGMAEAMAKWRNVNLDGVKDGSLLRSLPAPDLDTLRQGNDVQVIDAWRKFGLSSRTFSLKPSTPQSRNLLPLSMQLLKRLQGIPGKWTLSGPVEDQRDQIIEAVPPIIARMMGHQTHAAQTGQYVNLEAAVAETIKIRNTGSPRKGKNGSKYEELRIRANLYEREVLAQEQQSELMRQAEERASRAAVTKPQRRGPPPPPPRRSDA